MVVLATMPKYEVYKESGVEWLGDIPSHWKVCPLRYIAKVQTGNTPSKNIDSYYSTNAEGLPWIKPDELNEFQKLFSSKEKLTEKGVKEARVIPKDSVLVCCIGTIGKIGVSGCSLSTNQQINSITFSDKVISSFAKYLIFSSSIEHEKRANGNVVKILNADSQKSIQFVIPGKTEQTNIANFLDKKTAQIDEAITIKQKQIELLKERKQILIQKAVTQGLDPNVPMRDSGVDWIGEIPEHWDLLKLKHLFKEVNKRTKTGEEILFSLRMVQGLVPHDSVSDKTISNSSLIDYKIVERGQLVMNRMRAAIGIFGVAKNYGLVSPDYAVFNIKVTVNADYFLRLFKTSLMGTQFRLNSKGLGTGSSGFMRLYTESFGDIKIPFPSVDEQIEINNYIESQSQSIDDVINLQNTQIEKLKEYKTTLINSAVTGKVKVPNIN